ncbi:Serine/threonine-protein kinase N2, partial [Dissostichus eleginoides]
RFIFNRAGSQTEQRWYLRLRRRPTDARVKCLSVCIRLSLYHDPFKRIYEQQIKGIHNDVPLFCRDGTVVETAPPPLSPFNQSATIRADRATGNNRGGVTGGVTSEGWGVGIEGRPRQKTATPVQCPAWLFVAVGHVCDCVTLGFLIDRG